jgi:hypothetical protein
MKLRSICSTVGLGLVLFCIHALKAEDSAPAENPSSSSSKPASSLAPMAFLVGGEWEAKLPATPDGKPVSILAHFVWTDGHRAIRISNVYVIGDKTVPYIDGIYAWHPGKKTIVFSYVDSQGNFYEGTVKPETNGLVHDFRITDLKGEISEFMARQTWDGTNAWINEIFSRKNGQLEPEVKVRYEKKQP